MVLPDIEVPAVARSQPLGVVPGDQQISVVVALRLRDSDGLDRFLQEASSPGSAEYGSKLTPEEFGVRFGPTEASLGRVRAYLGAHGLTVDAAGTDRRMIRAHGTAVEIGEAFGTHERDYWDPQAGQVFFANDGPLILPEDVAAVVEDVSGLSSHTTLRPLLVAADQQGSTAGRTTPDGLVPSQYNSAYRLDRMGADGSGTAVALWEFDGYSRSNLATYDTQFGLSGPAVTTIAVDGASYDHAPGKDEAEVELDSEIIRGVAPKATQLVYEAPNSDLGEVDMAAQTVAENRVSVISMSWGSCEPDTVPATMTAVTDSLRQAAAQGITVFAASGDAGSRDCATSASGSQFEAVDFPASDPYVTATGGTTLSLIGDSYAYELAWDRAGGGLSAVFRRPPWQRGTNRVSTMRVVPDVAAAADPSAGFALYTRGSDGPAWQVMGGTSAAAPLWSGFTALYNQKAAGAGRPALGQANPRLYMLAESAGYDTVFHDVLVGANQSFSAGRGHDQVTGWGSPVADQLAAALLRGAAGPVSAPGYWTSPFVGGAVAMRVNAAEPDKANDASGLSPGLPVDPRFGSETGTSPVPGAFTMTATATRRARHRPAAENGRGYLGTG
ncbi:S53 family peptidase [Kitasatospora azatica]|uniref:S53 family peptidase n=1 Tax=Kitasatospora azatica TaxID=58347 RepID=UPI0018DD8B13|nr:S53 family peptidase [Kitasatospora azatica]